MVAHIRRIRPDDVERIRAARLAALADAPEAFASTPDSEKALRLDDWRRRTADASTGTRVAMFLASVVPDGDAVGIAGGVRSDNAGTVQVVSVWVSPSHRGRGLGARLVEAVADWARSSGGGALELWVADDNCAAVRLYERLGFERSNERRTRARGGVELRMVRALA